MCVLHNYLRAHKDQNYCPAGFADTVAANGGVTDGFWRTAQCPLEGLTTTSRSLNTEAFAIRERLKNYLAGPGSVPWQHQHVNRR